MTVTVSLTELLMLVMALTLLVGVGAAIRFMNRSLETTRRMHRAVERLEPRVEEALGALTAELNVLHEVTEHARDIGQEAETLTANVNQAAGELLGDVEQLRRSKRYVVAAGKGLQAGLRAWRDKQENHA